jgi:gas vesicle protein
LDTRKRAKADKLLTPLLALAYVEQVRAYCHADQPEAAALAALQLALNSGNVLRAADLGGKQLRVLRRCGKARAKHVKAQAKQRAARCQQIADSLTNRTLSISAAARMVRARLEKEGVTISERTIRRVIRYPK